MDLEHQTNDPKDLRKSNVNAVSKAIAIVLLLVIGYAFGYQNGRKGYIFKPTQFKIVNQQNEPQTVDYQLLWDAINIVNTKYIDGPLDPQKVLYGAIRGAVQSAGDPYTDFFEPQELQNFQIDLKGSFYGIGAEIGKKDGQIVVIAPLDGTPAQQAGLQAQDAIVQVDGQSTADWSVEQAVDKIRGDKGTKVTLTIVRQGKDKPFDVTIIRDEIKVKSVKWEFRTVPAGTPGTPAKKIAIITLSRFGDDTDDLFNQAVNEILRQSVDGIVLDLRNNPGGYLQTAVDVASSWVKPGDLVVKEARSASDSQDYLAHGSNRLASIHTVVLINGGSASAAEILSGALHDHKIAELIGEKSFGKGSVQELEPLKDGSAIKVTIAKWITPGGKNLNKDGLDPDVPVKLSDDDVKNNKDPQMDKALQEVTK